MDHILGYMHLVTYQSLLIRVASSQSFGHKRDVMIQTTNIKEKSKISIKGNGKEQ